MASDRKNLGLMDIFVKPMKVTLKQFFKSTFGKPTTVMYPLEKRDPPPTYRGCLLYTSPSPRDKRQSRMPSSA